MPLTWLQDGDSGENPSLQTHESQRQVRLEHLQRAGPRGPGWSLSNTADSLPSHHVVTCRELCIAPM